MKREPAIGPDGRFAQRAVLRGDSNNEELSFTFRTGLLYAEQIIRCELLKAHGCTVVEAPENWRYGYSSSLEWQHDVIQRALHKVELLSHEGKGRMMSGYDTELAQQILEAAHKSFPARLSMIELKSQLKPEPSDDALLTALDALLIDGLIDGAKIRTGIDQVLRFCEQIRITAEGRKRFSVQSAPRSGDTIHGDQFNITGQVGAAGRNSQGIVNVNERWQQMEGTIDLPKLAIELEQLRLVYLKPGSTRDDVKQAALLGDAAEAAENGDGSGVAAKLANAGPSVLKMARDIGTDVVAKVIAELMKG
jgi:hypothetical protein